MIELTQVPDMIIERALLPVLPALRPRNVSDGDRYAPRDQDESRAILAVRTCVPVAAIQRM